jgi:hypothetical protein
MLIHEAVVRDGEHPTSQIVVAAPKTTETTSDTNEHLAEHIFAVLDTPRPQVAMHRRSERGEDIIDRSFAGGPLVHPRSHSNRGCCHGAVVATALVVESVVGGASLSLVPVVVTVGSATPVVVDGTSATVVVDGASATVVAVGTSEVGESSSVSSVSLSFSLSVSFPLPWPAHGGGPCLFV